MAPGIDDLRIRQDQLDQTNVQPVVGSLSMVNGAAVLR
jgi:hypothetical protein